MSWLSYYAGAALVGLCSKADVAVTTTTPPALGLIGALLHKMRNFRHTIWEMDVYPNVAVALGAVRHRRQTVWWERWGISEDRARDSGGADRGDGWAAGPDEEPQLPAMPAACR